MINIPKQCRLLINKNLSLDISLKNSSLFIPNTNISQYSNKKFGTICFLKEDTTVSFIVIMNYSCKNLNIELQYLKLKNTRNIQFLLQKKWKIKDSCEVLEHFTQHYEVFNNSDKYEIIPVNFVIGDFKSGDICHNLLSKDDGCINMSLLGPDNLFIDICTRIFYAIRKNIFPQSLQINKILNAETNKYVTYKKINSTINKKRMTYFKTSDKFVCYYVHRKHLTQESTGKKKYFTISIPTKCTSVNESNVTIFFQDRSKI